MGRYLTYDLRKVLHGGYFEPRFRRRFTGTCRASLATLRWPVQSPIVIQFEAGIGIGWNTSRVSPLLLGRAPTSESVLISCARDIRIDT